MSKLGAIRGEKVEKVEEATGQILSQEYCFLGEFEHSLDSQRRIAVPKNWRTKEEEGRFVILPARNKSLQIIPFATFNEVFLSKAKKVSFANAEETRALAILGSRAQECFCDKQGRIQISQKLLDYAGLNEKVMLVGSFWHIQIWSPENYSKFLGSDENFFDEVQKITENKN